MSLKNSKFYKTEVRISDDSQTHALVRANDETKMTSKRHSLKGLEWPRGFQEVKVPREC
jgi:hypothetical protein